MKIILFFLAAFFMGVALSAQTPQSFRYQAVARDNSGNVLANQLVSFQISILSGSVADTEIYKETHTGLNTNAFGLVELDIGKGTPVMGTFSAINWGGNSYFVKVEMDPNGGTSYQWMGTSQLLSVPYALYAKDVQNNNDADADPANELQKISISGTVLTLDKSGGSVTLPSSGGGDNWGTQNVASDATLSGNGTTSTPLQIADNGVNSSKIADGSIVAADIANSAITGDKIANEAVTGAKIAQASATSGQALKWNGTTWVPATDETGSGNPTGAAGGDLSGTYPNPVIGDAKVTSAKIADGTIATADLADNAVNSEKLAGNAVTEAKIASGAVTGSKIAQAGATSGQALKWNGTTWAPAADVTGGGIGGWTDDGTIIRLTTTTDTVQLGNVKRVGKLNVGGDIGLNLLNSIYFGSDATRITSLTGGDLRFVAEDLSMLTTEDITFGHFGDATWIKFDNANKRVGIGTLSPTDRLHAVLDDASQGLSAIRGVATSAAGTAYGIYGQAAGFKGRGVMGEATGTSSIGVMGLATNTNSTGVWGEGSNQGVFGKSDMATGKGVFGQSTSATGYSGYFDGGKFYVSGNTGIGTTNPAKKLHVNGSAQVKDTLYANVVNASKITIMPGIAHNIADVFYSFSTSWSSMATVTVNLPAPGYVLLIASLELIHNHTYGNKTDVTIGVSKTNNGNGIKEIANWYIPSNTSAFDADDECVSGQAPLEVTSAGPQTFYLMGYRKGGDDYEGAMYAMIKLTALYFPVAYGTVD